ncbi:hypothetical protein DSM3645_02548 [Blastopirellula marina DSM 3645]|uniref:Uncharacterized protein n=1 Tax=Blastopirellula marina DSM 3645 TaxID=314230 RepID=A3ZVH3_9BACT|nr:hypothetical protein DSM3645_02548 [Blastopirellula marina DSM 3645]
MPASLSDVRDGRAGGFFRRSYERCRLRLTISGLLVATRPR